MLNKAFYSHHFFVRKSLLNDTFFRRKVYQVKFCMAEATHLKSILSNNISVLYVARCVLQRFIFAPTVVLSYRFCWHLLYIIF